MFVLTICVYKRAKNVSVTQGIWIYFVLWAVRYWHSMNFVKHCVLLWFFQEDNSTVILAWRIKSLSCYLSNVFMIIAQNYQALNNVPLRVKKCIHTLENFESDFVMTFKKWNSFYWKYSEEDISKYNSFEWIHFYILRW